MIDRSSRHRRRLSASTLSLLGISPAALIWLFVFLVPTALFITYSFFRTGVIDIEYTFTLDAYQRVLTDPLYLGVIGTTLAIALATALIVCVTGFAFTYYATFFFRKRRELLLAAMTVSLFSGYLVRIYAWRTILGSQGVVNGTLMRLGLLDHPIQFLLYSRFAVILVLVNIILPFAIIPLYSALGNVRPEIIEAARDLGDGPISAIRWIVIPLVHRGLVTAFGFSFVLAAGDYVTPQLVGGVSSQMVGNVIADQFGASFDWPLASAIGIVTTLLSSAVIFLFSVTMKRITR
jgi:spermidine/putrescine transport system permease protein